MNGIDLKYYINFAFHYKLFNLFEIVIKKLDEKKINYFLIGGGLGNAVLISIGKKMREQGCRVLYFAGYKKLSDRFKVQEIEEAADTVIWCCDEGLFSGSRSSDVVFHGNIIEAIKSYPEDMEIKMSDIQKMIVIGSDSLMAAVAEMRKDTQMPYPGIASVNSPMNCMMKEICAQCIQKHRIGDEDIYIYSCASQDQNIDTVDFKHLEKRLTQNSLLEKTADKFFTKLKHKN
jgi:NAD(P)H-flavin reductase